MASSSKRPKSQYLNRFRALGDDNNSDDNDLESMSVNGDNDDNVVENNSTPAKARIPPIKVLSQPAKKIHTMCATLKIEDYLVKKMSIGVKIVCESESSYEKILAHLKTTKLQYYTHPRKHEKLFKAVLFGIDAEPSSDIKQELIKLKLKCVDVKCITKFYTHGSDTIYIVYFENGSITLQDLKKHVPALFHTIVRWEHQRKPKNMLVQCRKCQIFGHGERDCYMSPKCAFCGNDHLSTLCKASDPDKYVCANCGGNHRSFDSSCPHRELYREIRLRSQRRFSPLKTTPNKPPNENPITYTTSHQTRLNINSYANAVKHNLSANTAKNNAHASTNNENLFSIQELSLLTSDLITKLKPCRTKDEQFHAVSQLVIKYLYSTK